MLHTRKRIRFLFTLLMLVSACCSAAPIDHFVTTWKTDNPGTSSNTSVTIPTIGPGYSYSVDWNNDNVPDDIGVTGDITHDYGVAGTYTIRIFGDFPRIYFNSNGDTEKILSIEQWGSNSWTSMANAFQGTINLVNNATDTPDLSNVSSLDGMFLSAVSVGAVTETANWNWNTSQIQTMNFTFHGAGDFNQDISSWNTSSVIAMDNMFFNALSFNQDISSWDTSQVQSMSQMFFAAYGFDQDLSDWLVGNVTDFTDMFKAITLSTANYDALLISWANQNINNALSFSAGGSQYCSNEAREARLSLALVDSLSIEDGGLCEEGYFMTSWKTDNPGTSNSTSITIPTKDGEIYFYRVDWNGDGDFDDVSENVDYIGDATHDYGVEGTYTVGIIGVFPRIYFNGGGDKDKILSVDQWGTHRFETMALSFTGASNLVINATDAPLVDAGGGYFLMFKDASSIGLGMGNWEWDTQGIDTMRSMFKNTQFNKDISTWNTSSVNDMSQMFSETNTFDQDISQWNVSNVDDFALMFQGAGLSTSNYDALLTGWDAQNLQAGVTLGAGNSTYCAQGAQDARANMIASDGWMINDGGLSVTCDNEVDLVVVVLNTPTYVESGEMVEYQIQVVNIGSNEVVNATMTDVLPPELVASSWICTPTGTASCGMSGNGQINDMFSIPLDGSSSVTYTVSATVTSAPFTEVYYQAIAMANTPQVDINLNNNTGDDLNLYTDAIFKAGFEAAVLIVEASKGYTNYDLSEVPSNAGITPLSIIKGVVDSRTTMWTHLRKVGEQIQIRVSKKSNGVWKTGLWEPVDVYGLISVSW